MSRDPEVNFVDKAKPDTLDVMVDARTVGELRWGDEKSPRFALYTGPSPEDPVIELPVSVLEIVTARAQSEVAERTATPAPMPSYYLGQ